MKYVSPQYKLEKIVSNDIILTSIIYNGEAVMVEKSESSAQVSTSVLDILGLR
ncbi:MAG: hypothetical protein IJ039_02845 [Clostridia bacterium]|nr:hypothetical protein [Clostridia bacterium]